MTEWQLEMSPARHGDAPGLARQQLTSGWRLTSLSRSCTTRSCSPVNWSPTRSSTAKGRSRSARSSTTTASSSRSSTRATASSGPSGRTTSTRRRPRPPYRRHQGQPMGHPRGPTCGSSSSGPDLDSDRPRIRRLVQAAADGDVARRGDVRLDRRAVHRDALRPMRSSVLVRESERQLDLTRAAWPASLMSPHRILPRRARHEATTPTPIQRHAAGVPLAGQNETLNRASGRRSEARVACGEHQPAAASSAFSRAILNSLRACRAITGCTANSRPVDAGRRAARTIA